MTKSVSELSSDVQLLTATFPAADVVQIRMALVMKRESRKKLSWRVMQLPDYLLVFGEGVNRESGKRGSTAQAPSNFFCPFQKCRHD